MKKSLLLLVLLFTNFFIYSQTVVQQPTQFNNVCDDNNDGIAMFYMQEITFEMIGNNPNLIVTHHETLTDAQIGNNPLPNTYANIISNTQFIYARVENAQTSELQFITYELNVNPTPEAQPQTLTVCTNDTTSFPCFNLISLVPQIVNGSTSNIVSFHLSEADAFTDVNVIVNPNCYISVVTTPTQPPLYYRITNSVTGCYSVGIVNLFTVNCSNNCQAPTAITTTQVTTTGAVIIWTNSTQTSFSEYYLSTTNTPPLFTTIPSGSTATGVFSINLTSLLCNTTYYAFVRNVCSPTETGNWSNPISFTTVACAPQPGQPVDLRQCINDNGLACFDLGINNNFIFNTLNPSEYTLTYHTTQTDAQIDSNSLASPYCIATSQAIYARFENNATQEYQIMPFALIVETVSNTIVTLNNIVQCDDNNDGVVTFDLTSNPELINSTATLEYYPSLSNAQNQVVPFANPSALSIGTQNLTTQIFVRAIVPDSCDEIYTFDVIAYPNCNVAYTCSEANSLCDSLGQPFANTTGIPSAGSYGCLNTIPNPTWFYLPVNQAGDINLFIEQNTAIGFNGTPIDADYVVFGPFSDPVSPCASQLTPNNIVSCSYSSSATETPFITNAQPGQYYLMMVTNFSNQLGYIRINQTNGANQGGIDCSGLNLNAFLDSNANGAQDNGEANFPLGQFTFEVNNNGTVHNIIAPSGTYSIYDTNPNNSYDIGFVIDPSYATSYGIATASYNDLNIIVGGGMQTYNFPITVTQAYNDMAVTIVPLNAPRPGFIYDNKIVYTNYGNQTVPSGVLNFDKDSLVTIIGNSQSGTTPTANGFSYSFTNLLPFETRTIFVSMQVPVIPTVTIGGLLTNTASIAPLTGDVVPENNTTAVTQIIIGSYDPNDKMEAHGDKILFSSFTADEYLYYTIRFENSGTASAINVRINDVLEAKLDETSIRMVSASHPYILDRMNANLSWKFDNIQLSVSVANTTIGKGYVTFKVKPKPGFSVGDIILNTASIYFDFNPAIITNTFSTEFVQQLAINEFENSDFVFYPNPVHDIVTVSLKNESNSITNIAVYDVLGKQIYTQKPSNFIANQTIDLSTVSKGIYLLEITTSNNLKVVKKLVVD